MVENEINKLISSLSEKPKQAKAIQLLKAIRLLVDEVSKEELVSIVGSNQKIEIATFQQKITEMEKYLSENSELLKKKEMIENRFNELIETEKQIKELETKRAYYNSHVKKLKTIKADLEEIASELRMDEIIQVFKNHQFENEQIFGALQNREGVLEYVKRINAEISQKLNEYDSSIKTLIEKRDKLPLYDLAENKKYQ
jgi:DNA repair exonuclease SbcCD ATPase subunit